MVPDLDGEKLIHTDKCINAMSELQNSIVVMAALCVPATP